MTLTRRLLGLTLECFDTGHVFKFCGVKCVFFEMFSVLRTVCNSYIVFCSKTFPFGLLVALGSLFLALHLVALALLGLRFRFGDTFLVLLVSAG